MKYTVNTLFKIMKNDINVLFKDRVVVKTHYGKIAGIVSDGMMIWKGIPYAKAPKGDLRFKAPQKPELFTKVYHAYQFQPICPQMIRFEKETENENCLNLNIYSSSLQTKKPVMVYIHGGAFIAGSGSQYLYNGVNIARKDIVVVTLNYRLGALGMFNFSFLDKEFVCNLALRDQLAALEWVFQNIIFFGGDPQDITVCGQSAGAISVLGLLNISDAHKYIKKAIAISPLPDFFNTEEQSIQIARGFLNSQNVEEKDAKEWLLKINPEQLNIKARSYTKTYDRKNGLDVLMPVIDGKLLSLRPLCSVKQGKSLHVPLLIGVTKNELDILFRLKYYKEMAENEILCLMSEEKSFSQRLIDIYGQNNIKKYYPMIARDFLIRIPSEWYASFHSNYAKTWIYRFDYENMLLKLSGMHATHALDLIFVFKNFDNAIAKLLFLLTPFKKTAFELSDRMQDDFVEFIKTGNLEWKCFSEENSVKIYDKDGDYIESAKNDEIRKLWKQTNFYNGIQ